MCSMPCFTVWLSIVQDITITMTCILVVMKLSNIYREGWMQPVCVVMPSYTVWLSIVQSLLLGDLPTIDALT